MIVAKIGIEPILKTSISVEKINKKISKNSFFFSFDDMINCNFVDPCWN